MRSEIEAVEKDARVALFILSKLSIPSRSSRITTRQARDAVSRTVQDSSDGHEVLMLMLQEIPCLHNRDERDDGNKMNGEWHM